MGAESGSDITRLLRKVPADDRAALDALVPVVYEERGLKLEECADALGVSLATVKNDLSFGRAWLARELGPHSGAAGMVS